MCIFEREDYEELINLQTAAAKKIERAIQEIDELLKDYRDLTKPVSTAVLQNVLQQRDDLSVQSMAEAQVSLIAKLCGCASCLKKLAA